MSPRYCLGLGKKCRGFFLPLFGDVYNIIDIIPFPHVSGKRTQKDLRVRYTSGVIRGKNDLEWSGSCASVQQVLQDVYAQCDSIVVQWMTFHPIVFSSQVTGEGKGHGKDMSVRNRRLLRECADTGAVAEIERLLQEGVDVNAADSFGFTALEYAMNWYPHQPDKDHLGVVKALVEGGAEVNAKA